MSKKVKKTNNVRKTVFSKGEGANVSHLIALLTAES
jgi:hypothetical protein